MKKHNKTGANNSTEKSRQGQILTGSSDMNRLTACCDARYVHGNFTRTCCLASTLTRGAADSTESHHICTRLHGVTSERHYRFLLNRNGEVFPVHAMKTYRGRRGTAPLTLNIGTRWRWVVNFMPRPHYPGKKNPDTHLKWDGVGTRAGLGNLHNSLWLLPNSKPGQPSLRPGRYPKHIDHFKLKYLIQPFCNQRLLLLVSIAMPQVLLPTARLQINPTLNHY
jgi:hypothetical protein